MRMDPIDPEHAARRRCGSGSATSSTATSATAAKWPTPDQYGPEVAYGPGGGLFKTTDGGKTWKKLTGEKAAAGLPSVKTGRIGLDYSRKTEGSGLRHHRHREHRQGPPGADRVLGLAARTPRAARRLDGRPRRRPRRQGRRQGRRRRHRRRRHQDRQTTTTLLDFMPTKKPDDDVKLTVVRASDKETKQTRDSSTPT